MAVNRFVLNGISYHGHGAINEIPGIVKSHGFTKAFVASDPDLVRFGVTKRVTDLLDKTASRLNSIPTSNRIPRSKTYSMALMHTVHPAQTS